MNLRKWQGVLALVVLLALSTVSLMAYHGEFGIWVEGTGSNQRVYAVQAVTASASEEGVPYVQVRMVGYNDWIGGNSYWCSFSRCATARADTGQHPAGGIFTAQGEIFIGHEKRESNQTTKRFSNSGEEVPLDYQEPEEEPSEEEQCSDPTECNQSPIIIPTTPSQAYQMTKAEDGVVFDIMGNGMPVKLAWTKANTELAFLALDRNGNGTIDNGTELFGNRTLPGVDNGFMALDRIAAHNNDGAIDAQDPLFAQLLLWTDRNHNGISEPSELRPASEVLEAVGLGYFYAERRDGAGNEFKFRSWARRVGTGNQFAREFKIYDVFLKATAQ